MKRSRLGIALLIMAALWLAAGVLRYGLSATALAQGRAGAALSLSPGYGQAGGLVAQELLRSGRPKEALSTARAAVAASPINVVPIRVAGMARDAGEGKGRGDALLMLASTWGWRDRPTQGWALDRAFRNGEWEIALARGEALIRLGERREEVLNLFRLVTIAPDGRALLRQRLSERPAWRQRFFEPDRAPPLPATEAMAQLLLDLQGAGAPPTKVEARTVLLQLISAGRFASAVRTNARLFGTSDLSDGDFSRTDVNYTTIEGRSTPFEWQLQDIDGASAAIDRGGEHRRDPVLALESDGRASGWLARQYVSIAPGTYRLSLTSMGEETGSTGALVATIDCQPRQIRLATIPLPAGPQRRQLDVPFTVPATCEGAVVQFSAAAVAGGQGAVASIDKVRLQRQR